MQSAGNAPVKGTYNIINITQKPLTVFLGRKVMVTSAESLSLHGGCFKSPKPRCVDSVGRS